MARDSFIRGCVFQASTTPPFESLVLLGGTNSTIVNCVFSDISYGYHALTVSAEHLDSVTISDNTFRRCHAQDIGLMGEGAVIVHSLSDATLLGPIVSGNSFMDNSGNNACDDIQPSIETPARISGNRFENSAGNGLPAVGGSISPWQSTPITLRENRFENCGYALHGSVQTDARFNHWGHNSGPFHEFDNPQGSGDTITGPAQFIPWLEDTTDSIGDMHEVPDQFGLNVYPNPFNSEVRIEYALAREQDVMLEIIDVLGRRVATLFDGRQTVGVHSVFWNADEFASGLYFARLSSPNKSTGAQCVKLLLIR